MLISSTDVFSQAVLCLDVQLERAQRDDGTLLCPVSRVAKRNTGLKIGTIDL